MPSPDVGGGKPAILRTLPGQPLEAPFCGGRVGLGEPDDPRPLVHAGAEAERDQSNAAPGRILDVAGFPGLDRALLDPGGFGEGSASESERLTLGAQNGADPELTLRGISGADAWASLSSSNCSARRSVCP